MKALTDEQIEKAVNWWAERVSNPVFEGLSEEEKKDPANNAYSFGLRLMTLLVKPVTLEQLENFKKALADILRQVDSKYYFLGVDYGPNQALATAAELSGISTNNFPIKTNMWFGDDGKITVQIGYGGDRVEL